LNIWDEAIHVFLFLFMHSESQALRYGIFHFFLIRPQTFCGRIIIGCHYRHLSINIMFSDDIFSSSSSEW